MFWSFVTAVTPVATRKKEKSHSGIRNIYESNLQPSSDEAAVSGAPLTQQCLEWQATYFFFFSRVLKTTFCSSQEKLLSCSSSSSSSRTTERNSRSFPPIVSGRSSGNGSRNCGRPCKSNVCSEFSGEDMLTARRLLSLLWQPHKLSNAQKIETISSELIRLSSPFFDQLY